MATPTNPDEDLTTLLYYDEGGRQAAIKTPTSNRDTFTVVRYLYDDLGRLASEIRNCTNSGTTPPADPATCTGGGTQNASTNVITNYAYDAADNKLSATSPDPSEEASGTGSVTTRYAYDANNRLCRVLENASVDLQSLTDPCTTTVSGTATSNVSTLYAYDEAGNLTSLIDGNGHSTAYGYDAQGRMTSLNDAENGTLEWAYDARGNRISQTNRDNTVVDWTFDGGDRMVERSAPGVATVAYQYDENGNRTSASDGTRTISAAYDRLNRPLTVSLSDDSAAATSYTYDFSDPSWTDASGTYLATLDAFGRETELLDPIHGSTPWTTDYRADGQAATQSDPTGNETAFAFDPLGRLTSKSTTGDAGSPLRATYAFIYNRAGQRVGETSTVTGDQTNGDVDYSYDPLARLVGYSRDGAPAQAYGWQPVPNRSSVQVGSDPAVTTTFDDANRPTSDSAGGSYASDPDGRLTARPGQTLEWDSLGRLTRVLASPSGATLATYTYDALDRLRTVDHGGSDRTRFRYVGLTTPVAQIVDDTNEAVLHSVGTSWSGELLIDWTGGGVSQRIYGTNGHHDLTWIAGPDGTVAGTVRYHPWGVVVATSGAGLPDFRFQSSWHDSTTELSWIVTRWYAPALGRFLSEDSLLGQPERPASRHLYSYAAGEPVERWDPDGQATTTVSVSFSSSWPSVWYDYKNDSWWFTNANFAELHAKVGNLVPFTEKITNMSATFTSSAVKYTGRALSSTFTPWIDVSGSAAIKYSAWWDLLFGHSEHEMEQYVGLWDSSSSRFVGGGYRRWLRSYTWCAGAFKYGVVCPGGAFGGDDVYPMPTARFQAWTIIRGHYYRIKMKMTVSVAIDVGWAETLGRLKDLTGKMKWASY